MINRLKIELEPNEYSALLKIAINELRNPSDQARYILRAELERRGLLQAETIQPAQSPCIDQVATHA